MGTPKSKIWKIPESILGKLLSTFQLCTCICVDAVDRNTILCIHI